MQKTAVIIKGNPRFVDGDQRADLYYADIKLFLERLGFEVSFDPGEPFTEPRPAVLWIGHSRGCDRLRFAPKSVVTVALGVEGGSNHPKDRSLKKGCVPDGYHYLFTDDMKEDIRAALRDRSAEC